MAGYSAADLRQASVAVKDTVKCVDLVRWGIESCAIAAARSDLADVANAITLTKPLVDPEIDERLTRAAGRLHHNVEIGGTSHPHAHAAAMIAAAKLIRETWFQSDFSSFSAAGVYLAAFPAHEQARLFLVNDPLSSLAASDTPIETVERFCERWTHRFGLFAELQFDPSKLATQIQREFAEAIVPAHNHEGVAVAGATGDRTLTVGEVPAVLPIVVLGKNDAEITYDDKTYARVDLTAAEILAAIVSNHPRPVGLTSKFGNHPERHVAKLPDELRSLLKSTNAGYTLNLPG